MKSIHVIIIIFVSILAISTLGMTKDKKSYKIKRPTITFQDYTDSTGLYEILKGINGHAVAWGDINNDGYLDLFVGTFAQHADTAYSHRGHSGIPEPNKLYINHGGKYFTTHSPSPTEVKGRSSGASFADFDNDGHMDLITAFVALNKGNNASWQQNKLYRNDGTGNLVDVCLSSIIYNVDSNVFAGRNTFVLDYDGDGLIDLLMQDDDAWLNSVGKSHLLKNKGNMVFEDVTAEAGFPEHFFGLGGFVGDINNDTWPDIFFAQSSVLYLNNKNGTFRKLDYQFFEHTGSRLEGNELWTCGADIGDLNEDGLLDIVMGEHFLPLNMDRKLLVFLNRGINSYGDPTFEEVSDKIGIKVAKTREPVVAIEDFDNDGDMDILVATEDEFIYTNQKILKNGYPCFTGSTGSNAPKGGLPYWAAGNILELYGTRGEHSCQGHHRAGRLR